MIEIEKGIPIPEHRGPGRERKYPWLEMDVGDSFVSDEGRGSARRSASLAGKRYGKRFVTRKLSDVRYRVWRVE